MKVRGSHDIRIIYSHQGEPQEFERLCRNALSEGWTLHTNTFHTERVVPAGTKHSILATKAVDW